MSEQSTPVPAVEAGSSPARDPAQEDFTLRLWRALSHPALLATASVVAALLLFSALILPQMPGQFAGDPAASARWESTTSADYGGLGDLARALGLFDVLHSPLLNLLLAITALLLLVKLANFVTSARVYQRLPDLVRTASAEPGTPLPITMSQPLYRTRFVTHSPPADIGQLNATEDGFDEVQDVESPLEPVAQATDAGAQIEVRQLGMLRRWAAYLRPLHIVGLLLALAAVWLMAVFGWQVTTPTLAPGASYHESIQDLEVEYLASQAEGETALRVQLYHDAAEQSLDAAGNADLRIGPAGVRARPGAPSLLIATESGDAQLARPGAVASVPSVGLVFLAPGSEESLLLPESGMGLRIVRSAASDGRFLVEVFASDEVLPVQRFDVTQRQTVNMSGENDDSVRLTFVPLPGLDVHVRAFPFAWLLWPALLLALIGLAGLVRPPAFLVLQRSPWPLEQTLVVAQSDDRALIELVGQAAADDEEKEAT